MTFGSDFGSRAAWWAAPVLLILTGIAMTVWTWQTWADVTIDFGREVYVPWQLTEGRILYRDIAYFGGPLSPGVNYLWFRLFGVSIRTLVFCNLAILTGLVCLAGYLLSRVASRLATTGACLVLLIGFAFGQPNYNFVCPYSHDITHGIVLAFAAISCIAGYIKNRKVACLAVAGVMLGLTFLTRPEVFAAALPAAVFGLAMTIRLERPPRRRLAMIVGVSAAAGLAPVLAAFALLRRFMETGQAWRGVLGGWAYIFNQELRGQPYYRSVMGVAGIDDNLLSILKTVRVVRTFLLCIAGLALLFRPGGTFRTWIAGGLLLLPALIILRRLAALNLVRPAPVLMLGVAVACFVAYLNPGLKPEARKRMIVRSMLAVFGLVLMAKILFKVQIAHYGFALALPAALVSVAAALDWIPSLIARLGGSATVVRVAFLALLLLAGSQVLRSFDETLTRKTYAVGGGPDLIRTDGRANFINPLLEEIKRRLGPDDTLLVLPEGVMVNYLARRINPTRYINFMPPELMMFGEENMVAAFRSHPPDYVVLVHKDTREYELPYFGQDYGQKIYSWVMAYYSPVKGWGDLPFQARFGILLLKRERME